MNLSKIWLLQPELEAKPAAPKHSLVVRYERILTLRAIAMDQRNPIKVRQANHLLKMVTSKLNKLYI